MYSNEQIDRKFIISRITEEAIYHKYLGIYPNTTDFFCNPLRVDRHPSCKFYISPYGVLRFKDFATGQNIDCFNVVEIIFGKRFYEACEIIARDFELIGGEKSVPAEILFSYKEKKIKEKPIIRVKRRKKFNKIDKAYWDRFSLSEDYLNKCGVNAVEVAWLSDEIGELKVVYKYKASDPCYVYHFGDYDYKLYYPFRKIARFLQNRSDILQGYNLLPEQGENLVITKSYKDVMCINMFSSEFDVYSVAPMSETALLTEEQFKDLYNRFSNIYSLMDRDLPGIRMAKKLRDLYQIPAILFAKDDPKDFAACLEKEGANSMIDRIEYIKSII